MPTLEEIQKKHLKRMAKRKRSGKDWKLFAIPPRAEAGATAKSNHYGIKRHTPIYREG